MTHTPIPVFYKDETESKKPTSGTQTGGTQSSGTQSSGTQTNADLISQMYDSNLASTNASLEQQYTKADSDLLATKEKNAQATDQNLNRAAVEGQKAAMNMAQLHSAQGLSSGASAMTRLSLENQTGANMTALRVAQQNADAEIERQRALLAQEYSSAIAKAQADNDLQKAQALYEQAAKDESMLLAKQEAAAGLMAKVGDFSLYQGLYGLTDEQVKLLQNAFAGSTSGSDHTSGLGSTSGSTTPSYPNSNSTPPDIPTYNPETDNLQRYVHEMFDLGFKIDGYDDYARRHGGGIAVDGAGIMDFIVLENALKKGEVYMAQQGHTIRFVKVKSPQQNHDGTFTVDGQNISSGDLFALVRNGTIIELFDPFNGTYHYKFAQ